MHIDVSDILDQDTGHRVTYRVQDEQPDLSDISLTESLNGEVVLIKTDFGLIAQGKVATAVSLECHRCLADFSRKVTARFTGEYSLVPGDEQWPVATDRQIDLAPLVRQEIWLELPIKHICSQDCLGLCYVCGLRQEAPHQHVEDAPISKVRWRHENKKG